MDYNLDNICEKFIFAVLAILSTVLLVVVIFSMQWRYMHDSPIMFYLASMTGGYGKVPYRDFFDMNMPGTYFVYYFFAKLFGFGDVGVRAADLCLLALTFFSTWIWMKEFGRKAAWAGCVLWGLAYLRFGPAMSLQREYLILVLIVLGIVVSTRTKWLGKWPKYFIVGLLFGIAFTVKPHSAIGLPVLLIYQSLRDCEEEEKWGFRLRALNLGPLLPTMLGFGIPVFTVALYLWLNGALSAFYDISKHYWPLYLSMTNSHETISGIKRYLYLLREYRQLGDFAGWLAAAVMGSFVSLYYSKLNNSQKREVVLLLGFAVSYSLYPLIAGQFWVYHWLLFLYFIIQLSVLCVGDKIVPRSGGQRVFITSVLMVTLVFGGLNICPIVLDQLKGGKSLAPKGGRVDEIAGFLQRNVRPEDTVQPLDWTGGAIHAMLLSDARLATHFIYDFHFYHHVSNPYIRKLRSNFIDQLERARPRFIIQFTGENKPWVSGKDTTREFVELQSLLERNYEVVLNGEGYIVYELSNNSKDGLGSHGYYMKENVNDGVSEFSVAKRERNQGEGKGRADEI